ncbi:hypothetical protein AX17_003779 [Amanita inopinata Kibby_2008]|nr:hypothetical protein AX17_003779 [Amanita inopinata Kibby_2008]
MDTQTAGAGASTSNYESSSIPTPEKPPEPWRCGESFRYGLPKNRDHWAHCRKLVDKHDKDMCDAWKDGVDKLLIFAGLFSSVVTAFTIQSYGSLREDPNETTARLLSQLLSRVTINNGSALIITESPMSAPALSTSTAFVPDNAMVRVNVFWFLSLTLSLTTVLIGTLCLQWLREYQRDAVLPTKDHIALRQMRFEGLVTWGVPSLLDTLPLLLQSAVVLFFIGLLDFMWKLNRTVAIALSVVIAYVILFLIMTIVSPFLQLFYSLYFDTPSAAQCPYKSPQSWLYYQFGLQALVQVLDYARIILSFILQKPRMRHRSQMKYRPPALASWTSYDTYWLRRREPKHDISRAILWIDAQFSQRLDVVYALYRCVQELNPLTLANVVFNLSYPCRPLYGPNESLAMYYKVAQEPTLTESQKMELLLELWLEKHVEHESHLRKHMTELYVRCMNVIDRKFLHDYFGPLSFRFHPLQGPLPPDMVIQLLMTAENGTDDIFPIYILEIIRALILGDEKVVNLKANKHKTQKILNQTILSVMQRCQTLLNQRETSNGDISEFMRFAREILVLLQAQCRFIIDPSPLIYAVEHKPEDSGLIRFLFGKNSPPG